MTSQERPPNGRAAPSPTPFGGRGTGTGRPPDAEDGDPVVRLTGVTKVFPGVVANDRVSLDLRRGEIHALLGENGAGKTTIMNVLYGLCSADSGEIEVEGRVVDIGSPRDARGHGIGMVHQHFMLVSRFSIVENIVLGHEPRARGVALDLTAARAKVAALSEKFGLDVDPDVRVEDASVGMQQRTEILKALYVGARILILDEPTAVLAPKEVDELFTTIRSLTAGGLSIFFITHKLEEVLAISDRVTVIRGGRVVETLRTADTGKGELARLMVGRDVVLRVTKEAQRCGPPALEVVGLSAKDHRGLPALREVTFTVHEGEILGVAGVDGNGQAELEETLLGLQAATGGRVLIGGEDVTSLGTRRRIDKGLALIPQDRQKRGLVLEFSVVENVLLGSHWRAPFARPLGIDYGRVRQAARKEVDEYNVKTSSIESLASTLSGGNQQKLILAREISRRPAVLLASQPTRGLDVGAIEFVHEQLLELRRRGVGILLISYELDEILSLSDRILVLYEGEIVYQVQGEEAVRGQVGLAMTGGLREDAPLGVAGVVDRAGTDGE